jgi:hypothetical protein
MAKLASRNIGRQPSRDLQDVLESVGRKCHQAGVGRARGCCQLPAFRASFLLPLLLLLLRLLLLLLLRRRRLMRMLLLRMELLPLLLLQLALPPKRAFVPAHRPCTWVSTRATAAS